MKEIVLDTETTGLDPLKGDRIIEIGCVELVNYVPTGRTFHRYINPECEVRSDAVAIHGLTTEFLRKHSVFSEISKDFLDFIGDIPLVIHNAKFDIGFLNAELGRLGVSSIPLSRATDTVTLARQKFPGSPANLDALCRRFGIDNTARTFHGALLDCQLLAECYLELMGGRQPNLVTEGGAKTPISEFFSAERVYRSPRPHPLWPEEEESHARLRSLIKDSLWEKIESSSS